MAGPGKQRWNTSVVPFLNPVSIVPEYRARLSMCFDKSDLAIYGRLMSDSWEDFGVDGGLDCLNGVSRLTNN
jgi:hypothetical protein